MAGFVGGPFYLVFKPSELSAAVGYTTVHIADDLRQGEVHLLQGFLPMLDSARGHGHEHTPFPQVATQHTDVVLGTKGATQAAVKSSWSH